MPMERETVSGPDTLVDFAYDQIRKDITEERLKAGSKIDMNALCEQYGISPTPIKQALNRLMAEEMVEGIPRKGYKVRRVTWREIDEVFELRLMMELHFAAQATTAVESNTLLQARFQANISANLDCVRNFTTADEYFHIYKMDQEFHELYIMASGSQAALRTYKGLNTHTYAAYLYGKQPKTKTVDGIVEHQEIYNAMLAGDVEEVRKLTRLHNENARNKIQLTFKVSNML